MQYLSFTDIPILDLPDGLKVKNLVRSAPTSKRFRDHTGEEYGFFEVLGFVGFRGTRTMWLLRCQCCERKKVESVHNLRRLPLVDCGECSCPKNRDYLYWRKLHQTKEVDGWETYGEYIADVGPLMTGYRVEAANPDRKLGRDNFRITNLRAVRTGEILVSRGGRMATAKEWAAKLGITYRALQYRFAECDKLGIPRVEALRSKW